VPKSRLSLVDAEALRPLEAHPTKPISGTAFRLRVLHPRNGRLRQHFDAGGRCDPEAREEHEVDVPEKEGGVLLCCRRWPSWSIVAFQSSEQPSPPPTPMFASSKFRLPVVAALAATEETPCE